MIYKKCILLGVAISTLLVFGCSKESILNNEIDNNNNLLSYDEIGNSIDKDNI